MQLIGRPGPTEVKTLGLHWGCLGMMEKEVETTIKGLRSRVSGPGLSVEGSSICVQGVLKRCWPDVE